MIMEETCHNNGACHSNSSSKKQDNSIVLTSSNWDIDNDKNLDDCVSTVSILQAPESTNLEDVVSLDTCVALKTDPSKESCKVEFKLTNKQKIARIAVVSEASVLEFFKQCGEYATTVFAEFVDDFQDHSVYFAEAKIQPPASEASIKFTRTKNKGTMWIYGIKLILTETVPEVSGNVFNLELINSFLNDINQSKPERNDMVKSVFESFAASNQNSTGDGMHSYFHKLAEGNFNSQKLLSACENNEVNKLSGNEENAESNTDTGTQYPMEELKVYIDKKFADLELRLMDKIYLADKQINQKLDAILKKLEPNVNE